MAMELEMGGAEGALHGTGQYHPDDEGNLTEVLR